MTCSRLALFVLAAAVSASCGPPPGGDDAGEGRDSGPADATDAGADAGLPDGGADAGPSFRRIVSLEVSPPALQLKVGGLSGVTATATFDDGSRSDVSGTVQWTASPAGVVAVSVQSVDDNLVRVEALAPGTAQVSARTGSVSSPPSTVTVSAPPAPDAGSVPPEARAVWVTRFAYNTAADVNAVIDKAAGAGFNVVYFQIRGNGDAYYDSSLVPWAKKLSGVLGKNPGWNPLQTAIDRARLRGIELHAYWNVYSAWPAPAGCSSSGTCTCQPTQGLSDSCALPEAVPPGAPEHLLRAHPEYMAVNGSGKSTDSEYYWFSPGNPQVKAHLLAAATELLTNYDIDGLHFDRVRYPGSSYSYDAASLAAYNAVPSPRPAYADWQRDQVSELVGQIYDALKQKRPKAVLSAAVWGIYKPFAGCNTSQGYGGYFQDSIGWMKAGKIDAITPMMYWDIGTGCTDWAKLLDGFMAGSNGRHVVAGMHAYDNGAPQPPRIRARIDYARSVGAAGTAVFASTYLNTRPSGADAGTDTWSTFRAPGGPYEQDAGTPPMTWR
ncbi:MAG: family 10 glycosylhydrolase [Myxococcales bacterium]|nr:family 10 glycosylhydrolase [Myxococcales bacterium]